MTLSVFLALWGCLGLQWITSDLSMFKVPSDFFLKDPSKQRVRVRAMGQVLNC